MKRRRHTGLNMLKMFSFMFALALILIGLVVLPMPIPLGAIMIVSGLVLLISASTTVALRIRSVRRHHRDVDKWIRFAEERLPASWKRVLKRTDP
jgi:hypothetical protein